VSQSSDDVAARGRAIFRRLRAQGPGDDVAEELSEGAEGSVAPSAQDEPEAPEADVADGADEAGEPTDVEAPEVVEPQAAVGPEPGPEAEALDDEEPLLGDLDGPRPNPGPGPAPGPLPGLMDLPAVAGMAEEAAEALDPPPVVVAAPAEPPATAPSEAAAPAPAPSPFARALPRVMAVANQKGGVGKTTTAVNLGACLADIGYRVLVVDLDPQGNASTGMGVNIRDLQGSMYDVVLHDLPIEDCVEATSVKNLFCAPSSLELAGAEIELVPAFSRELRLKRALDEVRDDYDFVLIDCPPSLGLLTVNAFAAATEVVVPIQCEYYALEGLGQLLRNVNLVQKNLNPALELTAIILVMYDARTKLADQVVNEVREHFGDKVCRQVVPRTVRLSEAPSFGQPIIAFDPSSRGAIAYRELAKEVSGGTPQRAG
jgi:chromosome partitioning protein